MKQKLLLLISSCCIAASSFATTYTITAGSGGGMTFTPASGIVANVGDTIKWVWATGSHTTTSTTIPGGATPWDHPLASATDVFLYKVTVAGTYNYKCTPHAPSMVGSFTVVGATGITTTTAVTPMLNVYPNPASGSVHVQFGNAALPASVALIDITGKEMSRNEYKNPEKVDLSLDRIPNGTYFIRAVQGGIVYKHELIVAH